MAPGKLSVPPLWEVLVLHVLGCGLLVLGLGTCVEQVLADGLWPVPLGLALVLPGAWLWALGARARLRRAGRLVKA